MEQTVLIVEDQKRLALALKAILEQAGYRTDAVFDGQAGLDYALGGNYDAVVLDVMLPLLDGFEVISRIRRGACDVPVIMLTARDTLKDKVAGLDHGADDYLTKPFQPAELLARLRALMRRQGTVLSQAVTLGNTVLDLETADISAAAPSAADAACADGQAGTEEAAASVHLSQREFEVCQLFMANPGQTISKARLLERIWGMDSDADENSVEAYVSFLRKKLAYIGSNLQITTLRMLGYRMEVVGGEDASGAQGADGQLRAAAKGDDA